MGVAMQREKSIRVEGQLLVPFRIAWGHREKRLTPIVATNPELQRNDHGAFFAPVLISCTAIRSIR